MHYFTFPLQNPKSDLIVFDSVDGYTLKCNLLQQNKLERKI